MLKCKACNAPINIDAQQPKCGYCGMPFSEHKFLLSSLRIETLGPKAEVIVPKNTRLPYVLSEIFSTAFDNQKSIQIHLMQGDSEAVNENRSLGTFYFLVEPPQPRAVPQIEITFTANADGELLIKAVNLETEKSQEFRGIALDVL